MKFGDILSYTFAAACISVGTVNVVGSVSQDVDKDAAKKIEIKMKEGKAITGAEAKTYYAYNSADEKNDDGGYLIVTGIGILGIAVARRSEKKKKDGLSPQ